VVPFGIELANAWPGQGRLLSFEEIKIITPANVALHGCSEVTSLRTGKPKGPVEKMETLEGTSYKTYTYDPFEVRYASDFQYGYYDTDAVQIIICRIKVEDPQALLGMNPVKSEKTFAIQAKYKYQLQQELSVSVANPNRGW
jgi:hypothetical protein